MTYHVDAYSAADEIIETIKTLENGRDYTEGREEIARVFDEELWNGNWDSSTYFENGFENIRFIQEDEFDQSMDDDEKPSEDDYIAFVAGHYAYWA